VVGITVLAPVAWWLGTWPSEGASKNLLTHLVERGEFTDVVVEQGEVESSSNVEIRCEVKTRNSQGIAIIEVIDEGTRVKPGDILFRLDSSALEQDLVQQQIIRNTSEALMIQARNESEAATIAYTEYADGVFHQEEQRLQSQLFIAEENLRRAQEYAKYSERLASRGYVTVHQLEGDQFAVEKAKTELEVAKTELRVLQEFTKEKTLIQLGSDIKTTEAKWKSEQSSHQLELANLQEIEDQIEKCTVRAPKAGQAIHANETSRRGSEEFVVEPGALVREQQVVVRVPDPNRMQVRAKINESRVTSVKPGMKVRIRLDALGDEHFDGEVTRVNEYPEPGSWYSSEVKQYATFIEISDPPKSIRPGLTAEVQIEVDHREDVVTIPVQSIYERSDKFYCLVRRDDEWLPTEVQIATSNDRVAVIESGLNVGVDIALQPKPIADQRKRPETDTKLARANDSADGEGP